MRPFGVLKNPKGLIEPKAGPLALCKRNRNQPLIRATRQPHQ